MIVSRMLGENLWSARQIGGTNETNQWTLDYCYYTIQTSPRLVSATISACAAGIGIFDCSLCALNHSALQHVNEAIHRRVTCAAPSCFGRESPWVVPARAKRVSRTFDAPPGGFSFLLSAVFSAAFLPSFRTLLLYLSIASRFRGAAIFRENSRHAPPLPRRIFSCSLAFPGKPLPLYLSYKFSRDIRETECAVTTGKRRESVF